MKDDRSKTFSFTIAKIIIRNKFLQAYAADELFVQCHSSIFSFVIRKTSVIAV